MKRRPLVACGVRRSRCRRKNAALEAALALFSSMQPLPREGLRYVADGGHVRETGSVIPSQRRERGFVQ